MNMNRSLEEAASNPHGGRRGARASGAEVTADAAEAAGERDPEVGPEDGAESLHLRIKPEQMRSCSIRTSKESGFLGWNLLLRMR